MEIWKKHKDYNYEISNLGNARRIGKEIIDEEGNKKRKETKPLKPRLAGSFTSQVAFSKTENGVNVVKFFSVNKLVAELFLPKPKKNEVILSHLDGNPMNNKVENLKWITRKEWTKNNKEMIEKRTILSVKIRAKKRLEKAEEVKKEK